MTKQFHLLLFVVSITVFSTIEAAWADLKFIDLTHGIG